MSSVQVPEDFDAGTLAEFVEAHLLIDGDDYLSATEFLALFPAGQQPSDTEVQFGFAEVERRSKSLGTRYPYVATGRGVRKFEGDEFAPYEFLLLMSMLKTPVRIDLGFERSDPLFDAIVREAFKAFLGPASMAVEFGYPPRNGRPAGFSEAVSWLGGLIGLKDLSMDRPSTLKDAGVDIVAWRPLDDGRVGFPLYLIQNTVQLKYASKPRDVLPSQWHQWYHLPREPLVGFAVPFAIAPGDDRWRQIAAVCDLPFDRMRLMSELKDAMVHSWPEFADIIKFVSKEKMAIADGADYAGPAISRPRKVPRKDLSTRVIEVR